MFLKIVASVTLSAAGCYCQPLIAETPDPLTQFLNSRGFANIPYSKQNQAHIGSVVAAPFGGGVPTFETPPPVVPAANPDSSITMPGEEIGRVQAAGLAAKAFGINLGADFSHPETLAYQTTVFTGPQIDIDQVRTLLQEPQVVAKLDHYKGGFSHFEHRQLFTANLFIVSGVFFSKELVVTSSSGEEISLRGGATIPNCPPSPAVQIPENPGGDETQPQNALQQTSGAHSSSGESPQPGSEHTTPSNPPNHSPDANVKPQEQLSVTLNGQVKPTESLQAAAASGIPTASGYYCRLTTGGVRFTSKTAIPIAMEVYVPLWNGQSYTATAPHPVPAFAND